MLLHKSSDIFLVHEVVLILLPVKCWAIEHLVSPGSTTNVLLDLHIIVCQSGDLASLPGEVADVETVLDWDEEEEAVNNDGPLVDVTPHCWV